MDVLRDKGGQNNQCKDQRNSESGGNFEEDTGGKTYMVLACHGKRWRVGRDKSTGHGSTGKKEGQDRKIA